MLFIRPRVPRADGAPEDVDAPCGNDARHNGFERAGPRDRAVRLHVGADPIQTGIIVGLFSLVHAPANLFFGRIADRIGRKLPLEIGLLWDSVSLFLYAFATTPLLLALVRISHGVGSGFVGPSSMALMADTSTS